MSLSSLVFGLALTPLTAAFYPANTPLLLFTLIVSLLIVVRHESNIRRLLKRTEPRLGLWLKLFRRQK